MIKIEKLIIALCYFFLVSVVSITIFASDDNIKKTKIVEEAKVISVIDGDTIKVSVTKEFNVRLLDCWAPEITGPNKDSGLNSKRYLESILKSGDKIIVEIPTTNRFEDSVSLGRMLGYVWKDLNNDGKDDNISENIVKSGFATKTKTK